MMDSTLITALQISGVGILVLLVILSALAGVVYLMTRFIVDKEEEESTMEESVRAEAVETAETKADLKLAAAVAVAIARAQADVQTVPTEEAAGEINAWRAFGLQRRLTQSSTLRRTR